MKVTITLDCENAAFDPYPNEEVARILQELSRDAMMCDFGNEFDRNRILLDTNGNRVGVMKVTGRIK